MNDVSTAQFICSERHFRLAVSVWYL